MSSVQTTAESLSILWQPNFNAVISTFADSQLLRNLATILRSDFQFILAVKGFRLPLAFFIGRAFCFRPPFALDEFKHSFVNGFG